MARRESGTGSVDRLPSGKYRCRWYTPDGRHPSRSFNTVEEAERFLRKVRVELDEGRDVSTIQTVTLQTVIDQWWAITEKSVKPRTAERYLAHARKIEKALGAKPISQLNYETVQGFVTDLQRDYAPKTVHHTYGVLSLILKHALRLGRLERPIPKPILPRISKPRLTIPSRDQVEQLAEASQAWTHAAVILAGYCGLRQGELLALHRSDVNLDEGWVFIHQARNKSSGEFESTKTDAVRRVYLPERVAAVLREHLDEYEGAVVFPVTASIFDKSWRRAREATNLPGVRFHDLRHAAASMMIAAGLSVLQVSKQLGHANATQTLDTYGHLWPDSFDDAMRRMDAYLDAH